MTLSNNHTTVLLNEAVEALCINPDETYIDGTFGRGGHTQLLLAKLSANGRVIAFDKDARFKCGRGIAGFGYQLSANR